MRKELYKKLCFLCVLLCLPLAMMGQSITVTGTVTDGTLNASFPGATVTVKGTTIGQVTDLDGHYSINVPSRGSVLVFSFLGYKTQELAVGNRTVIDVVLQEDNQVVEEVVVIAYGTQNKGLVTSAISSVSTKDLVKSPATSVTNMLAGSVPGVSAVQDSGKPGADAAEIRVRGAGTLTGSLSKPLILIDGVERDPDGVAFSQLDPNEIESISVLKDASSTAVFGVRGANGVILVTTRRGAVGKPTINVSASLGVQQPISLVEQVGSYEYAKFWNARADLDIDRYGGSTLSGKFTPEQVEAYRTGSDPIMYPNKNWMKEVFNDVFLQSKNNINISGGSENVKYFVSLGYLYQNGIIKQLPFIDYDNNYRFNRYNYRANLDVKLSPTTQMKMGVGGYVGKRQAPVTTNEMGNDDESQAFALIQSWTVPFGGPGVIDGIRTWTTNGHIPYGELPRDGYYVFSGGYRRHYTTTLNLDVDITQDLQAITKGLTVAVKGAYNNSFTMTKTRGGGRWMTQTAYYKSHFPNGDTTKDANFAMPETDPDFDKTHVFVPGESLVKNPLTYGEGTSQAQSWYIEGRLNYDRTFGDHRVSGLFLYNQSREYYPKEGYAYIPRGYIGYVFRATYAYKSKYLADFSMGYNGSENFAPGKTRYGLFPSASVGWVVSEEAFMKKQNAISYLKLRASFGRVGNDKSSSRFLYAPTVWSGSGSYSFGAESPVTASGMAMGTEGNPGVTWEIADKQNYGLDIKFLDDRLSLSADYFREHRTGILIKPNSFPNITGITWPFMNIGIINNRGYEVTLGWNDSPMKDFNYYVNANVSYARNKIIYIDEVPNAYSYMDYTGHPSGVRELLLHNKIRGPIYKFERLYNEDDFIPGTYTLKEGYPVPSFNVRPGDAMYADMNGDGLVNDNDKIVTGHGLYPEYTFGLNAGFTWKGLSFSMQWVGATNFDRYMFDYFRYPYTNTGSRGLLTYFYNDCWTYENPNGTLPSPALNATEWNYANSTLWLKEASYLRLKNLTIGYTFNHPSLKKAGISSLGITLSGYNLLTFTKLKYLDPESKPSNDSGYPLVRLYSLGVNINF